MKKQIFILVMTISLQACLAVTPTNEYSQSFLSEFYQYINTNDLYGALELANRAEQEVDNNPFPESERFQIYMSKAYILFSLHEYEEGFKYYEKSNSLIDVPKSDKQDLYKSASQFCLYNKKDLECANSYMQKFADSVNTYLADGPYKPVFKLAPKAPDFKYASGAKVELMFDILENGATSNVHIEYSDFNEKYNSYLISIAELFKYKPTSMNGIPIIEKDVKNRIVFEEKKSPQTTDI